MKPEYAQFLKEKSRLDYNAIAGHFSNTRSFLWPEISYFEKFIASGERVLDLGCGNGRLLALLGHKNISYFGVDKSEKLIAIAKNNWEKKEKSARFMVADALKLPFGADFFDKIFSVAVLHHLPSDELRKKFFQESKRVLKQGGLIVLTVWNLKQKKFIPYRFKYFFLKLVGFSRLDFGDIFYPWKSHQGKVLAQRYLHCFSKNKLISLAKEAGFKIEEVGFLSESKKNLYLVARK